MQLEWVGHSGQLVQGVSELLDAAQLVDVTIMAEGKKLRAHRLILSAASTYFKVKGCYTININCWVFIGQSDHLSVQAIYWRG